MVVRLLDEMLHNLGGQYHLLGPLDRFVDFDHLVEGQIDNVIAPEQKPIGQSAEEGELGQLSQGEALWEGQLDQFNEPQGSGHG
jgi:hypothetical protein